MNDEVSSLWKMYENGVSYQLRLGIKSQIPLNIDFYEGRQWGNTNKLTSTKDLPRPIINIVKMICRNKKSAVLANNIKLIFRSDIDNEKSDFSSSMTDFADYIQKEIGQAKVDSDAIDDGIKKGTYIYHYYWDATAVGMCGDYEGGVRVELIDPLNIFFENPNERDEQKQKWILIATRVSVEYCRKLAENLKDKLLIDSDNDENVIYETQESEKKCTLLTRYFKKDGEVYFERAVKNCILHKPRPLNPDLVDLNNVKDDIEEVASFDRAVQINSSDEKFNLYPIVVGTWEKREKSIYGLSEVEDIIPNQKAINRTEAVKQMIAQAQSSSKIVSRLGNAEKLTNNPFEVLIDKTDNGRGYYTLPAGQISPIIANLTEQLISNTRTVAGATEIMSGELASGNLSGTAIAQLQGQALTPIQDLKNNFLYSKIKIGKILVEFFKMYYEEKAYAVYNDEAKKSDAKIFNGKDFKGKNISVICEIGSSGSYSDAMLISIMQEMLKSGKIDMSTYIKAYPDSLLPNKNQILNDLKAQENNEISNLKNQMASLQTQAMNYQNKINESQKLTENAVSIINENRKIKELLLNLQTEYMNKINKANEIINGGTEK